MTISDFRINNYLETDHGFAKVVQVFDSENKVKCATKKGELFETEKFAPTFLTSKLLLSINGFSNLGENCYIHPKMIGYLAYNHTIRMFDWINSDGTLIRTVEFLNTLQNIYWAITGEELIDSEKPE